MASGGKRKGAGRKPTGKESVYFWLGSETMELLRELVPSEERGSFVEEFIRRELLRRKKRQEKMEMEAMYTKWQKGRR